MEEHGVFTIASLRKLVDNKTLSYSQNVTYWNKNIPSKVNILLWRARLERLATLKNLSDRGIKVTSFMCPICLSKEESKNHLFLEWSIGKEVLAILYNWWSEISVTSSSMEDLLNKITTSDDNKKMKINIGTILLALFFCDMVL